MRNNIPILFNFLKKKDKQENSLINQDALDNAILLSMLYISRNTRLDGRFVYRNSATSAKKYSDRKYSSLRHAGTLYSMYLCERYLNNDTLKNKRVLASNYLVKNYIKRVNADRYGLVSKPDEEAPVYLATSGGTGLALIALSNLLPEKLISVHTLRKMGNFLLWMQSNDGDFWPSYEFVKKEKSILHSARYYPGEACLGLLYLYEVDKDERWLIGVQKGIMHIARTANEKPEHDIKFDHWGILAAQKLFQTENNGLTDAQKAIITGFVEKNVKSILELQNTDPKDDEYGSFRGTRTLCGLATLMEGLIAAYDCVPAKVMKTRIKYAIEAGLEHLYKYQVKSGEMEGGIPGTYIWNTPAADDKDREVRIDNVQHAISAWITYKKLLNSEEN